MSEWITKPLQDIVSFQKGKKVNTSEILLDDFVNYLGAGSLVGNHDGYASAYNAVIAQSDNVLMLWDGERSGLVGHSLEGVVSSTVSKLTCNDLMIGTYLYYFLQNEFEWIQNRRTGTGVPHVPKDLSRILHVNYPKHKKEQQKIATILSTIDKTIERTEALIAKYQQIKAGMMHDLFTRGLLPDGTLRPSREEAPELYKESAIGWIPKEWKVNSLKSLMEYEITYGIVQAGPHIENGIPYIRTGDMSGDFLLIDNLLRTSKSIANNYKRSEVKTNEIVCAIRATVGKVLMVPYELNEANLTQGTARISPKKEIDNIFLLWTLRNERTQRSIQAVIKGTTFSEITLKELRELLIAIPKKNDEQARIGERIDSINQNILMEKEYLEKLQNQKSGLMHDLLTGNVRVTLEDEAS